MPTPTPKHPAIEAAMASMTGITRQEALDKAICTWCKAPLTEFKDQLSEREFQISGMCQACQDEVFE